jgi:t-SNARE complex subunit (syntaxin)
MLETRKSKIEYIESAIQSLERQLLTAVSERRIAKIRRRIKAWQDILDSNFYKLNFMKVDDGN